MSEQANGLGPDAHSAACILHEVNQPLAAILMNAEAAARWLTRDPPNLNRARKALGRVIEEGNRVANISRSMQDLIHKTPPAVTTLDLNGVIKDVLTHAEPDLRRDSVTAEIDLAENLQPITGDRLQLERLAHNLIANASEAMSAVKDRPRKLRISTQRDGQEEVLVTVADTGTGIDPEQIDRIFDPFFTTKGTGMCLGLSICRMIVEAHGGRLWATPNVPYGSILSFNLAPTPR